MGLNKYFSERHGFKPSKTTIQLDDMDGDLRISMWNAMLETFGLDVPNNSTLSDKDEPGSVLRLVWILYYKKPADNFPVDWMDWRKRLRNHVLQSEWHEVYELIEFMLDHWIDQRDLERFAQIFNFFLERELSGYRIINGIFTAITDKVELEEIEQALEENDAIRPVRLQLEEALRKLSNKQEPDYRGSIKDSISAVETLSRLISDEPKLELGKALKELEKTGKVKIHGALRSGFSNLYGWTSDDQGIRHGLMDEPNVTFEDAKYMLVSCSAFINYLIAKAAKAGLEL